MGDIAFIARSDRPRGSGVTLLFTLRDFPDRDSALAYHKQVGQRGRGTLME